MTPWLTCALVIFAGMANLRAQEQSPYKTAWSKEGIILGAAGLTFLAGSAIQRNHPQLTQGEIDVLSVRSINWFDRSAAYRYSENLPAVSDVFAGAAAAATPLILLADPKIRNDLPAITFMYAETIVLSVSLPEFAKSAVRRMRPFVYNKNVPAGKKNTADRDRSFFSGHTTLAFASTVFLATVYGDYHPGSAVNRYLWGAALITGCVTGMLRYESGMHYPSDILTGAAVGTSIGYLIPYFHRTDGIGIELRPAFSGGRPVISIQKRL